MRNGAALAALLLTLTLVGCGSTTVSPTPSPSAAPSPAPSATSTETPAPAQTEAPTGGVRADGTFDETTLFIGDSLTYGLIENYLIPNALIGDASYMAIGGMPLKLYWSDYALLGTKWAARYGCTYSEDFYRLSYAEAVEQSPGKYKNIYLMLGTNLSAESTAELYIQVAEHILEHQSEAVLYLQTVPPSDTDSVDANFVNDNIAAAVEHFALLGDDRVKLLDVNAVLDKSCLYSDGIHLISCGQERWYQLIVDNSNN